MITDDDGESNNYDDSVNDNSNGANYDNTTDTVKNIYYNRKCTSRLVITDRYMCIYR